jgi:hypothetical protein
VRHFDSGLSGKNFEEGDLRVRVLRNLRARIACEMIFFLLSEIGNHGTETYSGN